MEASIASTKAYALPLGAFTASMKYCMEAFTVSMNAPMKAIEASMEAVEASMEAFIASMGAFMNFHRRALQ